MVTTPRDAATSYKRGSLGSSARHSGRWERNEESIGHGIGTLVYTLIDTLVDDYFGVVDGIAEQVADAEEQIMKDGGRKIVGFSEVAPELPALVE